MQFLLTGTEALAQVPNFKLVGRDQELERLTSILLRSKQNSIILFGAGGAGCTALLNGLQASKDQPDAPFDIVSKRFVWLQTDALFSSGTTEQITDNFRKIIAFLEKTADSVLIIEDTRDFIEACRNNGCGNFINSLNNTVKTGKTQAILETRDEDLEIVLKAHSDMRECYTLMDLPEPENGALEAIVAGNAERLAKYHGIKISQDAIDASIEFTTKYRSRDFGSARAQPERALSLLDRTLASYRLNAHAQHPQLDALIGELGAEANTDQGRAKIQTLMEDFEKKQNEVKRLYKAQRDGEVEIQNINEKIDALREDEDNRIKKGETSENGNQSAITSFMARGAAGGYSNPKIIEEQNKIKLLQGAIDDNRKKFEAVTAQLNEGLIVTRNTVVDQFSLISGISASKLNQDERKQLLGLEPFLNSKVFGQTNVIRQVSNAVKIARVGKKITGKPQAAFMFIGSSGTGKTELAKQIAAFLLGDQNALFRLDMSEYQEKHAVAKLIGSPPGYEGFEAGGILTNAMRKNPRRVILFDEMEKAHPDIFDLGLQILDDSRLTDNLGRVVSFDDAVIIMSSNVGSEEFLNESVTDEEAYANAMAQLEMKYRPEFLNRFNGRKNIVAFHRLDLDSIGKIVNRELNKISSRYVDDGLSLVIPESSIVDFCKSQYIPKYGARGMDGYLKTNLEPILANLCLEQPDFKGTVSAIWDASKQTFDIETKTT
jgi:ATP-dependent Clp protease ATP-binding subunit ClpB